MDVFKDHDFLASRPSLREFLERDAVEYGGTGVGRDLLRNYLISRNERSLHPSYRPGSLVRELDDNVHQLIVGARLLDALWGYEDTRDVEWIYQHQQLAKRLCAAEDRDDHALMRTIMHRNPKSLATQFPRLQTELQKIITNVQVCTDTLEYYDIREKHSLADINSNIARFTRNERIISSPNSFSDRYDAPGTERSYFDDAWSKCTEVLTLLSEMKKVIEIHERSEDVNPDFPYDNIRSFCLQELIPALRDLTGEVMHATEVLRDDMANKKPELRRTALRPELDPEYRPNAREVSNVVKMDDRLMARDSRRV